MVNVSWRGDAIASAASREAIEMARLDAETVLGISQNRVPLKDSPLRNSKYCNNTPKGAEIGYNTKYAVIQHEKQFQHYTTPGTGPNYLRGPLLEFSDQFIEDINTALKAVYG